MENKLFIILFSLKTETCPKTNGYHKMLLVGKWQVRLFSATIWVLMIMWKIDEIKRKKNCCKLASTSFTVNKTVDLLMSSPIQRKLTFEIGTKTFDEVERSHTYFYTHVLFMMIMMLMMIPCVWPCIWKLFFDRIATLRNNALLIHTVTHLNCTAWSLIIVVFSMRLEKIR